MNSTSMKFVVKTIVSVALLLRFWLPLSNFRMSLLTYLSKKVTMTLVHVTKIWIRCNMWQCLIYIYLRVQNSFLSTIMSTNLMLLVYFAHSYILHAPHSFSKLVRTRYIWFAVDFCIIHII